MPSVRGLTYCTSSESRAHTDRGVRATTPRRTGTASKQRAVMALDQGTTSSRAFVFDHDGRPVIAVSKGLAEDLKGVVLQVEETEEGTRLQMRERG